MVNPNVFDATNKRVLEYLDAKYPGSEQLTRVREDLNIDEQVFMKSVAYLEEKHFIVIDNKTILDSSWAGSVKITAAGIDAKNGRRVADMKVYRGY